ncbi:MAG: 4-(cytidine 5'-diphospho)-2-C-methyl-D-erythritol kinase [bacterium]|nr:4-(cytidine 5'-diphospho)-2-C-methyl-D-erythritol kinase [bacterium]
MILFPNCKINLGLHIINRRLDGYHNLETLFYPVPLCDALEVIALKNEVLDSTQNGLENNTQNSSEISRQSEPILGAKIIMEGIPVAGNPENNLVFKAYALLKEDYSLGAVEFCLLKNIPMGAGLGGGSSDGAFAIKLLNKLFKLEISIEKQEKYAAKLGSDCSFFIQNTPCIGTGRGEILEPISLSLKGLWMVLVKPNIHIGTAEAFAQIKPRNTWDLQQNFSLKDLPNIPIENWKNILVNDFEASIFPNHLILSQIKESLYQKGAIYAAMSGSGSTIFGLFKVQANLKNTFPNLFYFESKLD